MQAGLGLQVCDPRSFACMFGEGEHLHPGQQFAAAPLEGEAPSRPPGIHHFVDAAPGHRAVHTTRVTPAHPAGHEAWH
jgi:hypothetical protein